MTDRHLDLQVAWQLHVSDRLDHLDGLVSRHREKHRRYHTVAHVAWVVRHVEELAADLTASPDDPADLDTGAAVAAAFFHDAVYEPRSPARANERASARLARRDLADLDWAPDRIERVAAMIEATADHLDPIDVTAAVLFDADVSVLAADPAAYSDYARNVRAEYAHVADDDWQTGRAAVLRSFLDRPSIFATRPARGRWEERARANLTSELTSLT